MPRHRYSRPLPASRPAWTWAAPRSPSAWPTGTVCTGGGRAHRAGGRGRCSRSAGAAHGRGELCQRGPAGGRGQRGRRVELRPLRSARRLRRAGGAQHLRRPGRAGARPAQHLDERDPGGPAAGGLPAGAGGQRRHRRPGGGAPLGRPAGAGPLRLRDLEHRHRHGPVRRRTGAARQERQCGTRRPHVRQRQRRRAVWLRQHR
jgi:hypothetical protein